MRAPAESSAGESNDGRAVSGSGARRGREVLRRLVLLTGALVAAWCIVWPVEGLYRVRTVDFARLQKKEADRMRSDLRMMSRVSGLALDPNDPTLNPAPTLALSDYIARQTKDRLVTVSGGAWTRFFEDVRRTLSGEATTFAGHLGVGSGPYLLYFPVDTPPLPDLGGPPGPGKEFTYVALTDGDRVRYLEILYQRPPSAGRDAPNRLLYPWRHHAVWWFVAGLLGYAAMPWYRRGPDELRFGTGRAMVTPDFLGLALAVVFAVLPAVIITNNARGSEPLDVLGLHSDWWPLTAVFWFMAAGGVAIMAVASWYACFSLWITPTGLRRRTLWQVSDHAFADMVSVTPVRWAWPPWLRAVALLIGLLNSRLLGAVLIGSAEEAYGIAIRFRDGTTLKLWLSHLPGFERIFHALQAAGVPLDPELRAAIEEDLASPAPAVRTGRGGVIAARILISVAVAGTLTWHYWPETPRVVKHESTFTPEALAQRRALLREMQDIVRQMQQALTLPPEATAAQRAAANAAFEALQKRHEAVEQRYNAIKPTIED